MGVVVFLVALPLSLVVTLVWAVRADARATRLALGGLGVDERAGEGGLGVSVGAVHVEVAPVFAGVPALRRYDVSVRGLDPTLHRSLLDDAGWRVALAGLPVTVVKVTAIDDASVRVLLERGAVSTASMRDTARAVLDAVTRAARAGALVAADAEGAGTGAPVAVPVDVAGRGSRDRVSVGARGNGRASGRDDDD